MNRFDWRQIARDLAPLLPIVAVCAVLAFNIALHHDAYVPKTADIYVAPLITAEPSTSTTDAPAPTTTVVPPARAAAPLAPAADVWDRLADCESGDRLNGVVIPGTARWQIANSIHQGGLQFAVATWDAYRPAGFPADAQNATRAQQIAVALRVRDGVPGSHDPYLNPQGWGAWPRCSRTVGLRP